jgi:hypothetical protein
MIGLVVGGVFAIFVSAVLAYILYRLWRKEQGPPPP